MRFSVWPARGDLPVDERWRSRSNEHAVVLESDWPAFAAWLAAPIVGITGKHEQAFSPLAAIQPGKGGRRNGGPAAFFVGEYDDAATIELVHIAERELAKFDAVLYTTASATPDKPRFRFVVRTSRDIADDQEYRSCTRGCERLFGVMPQDSQRTRLWYRPIETCHARIFRGGRPLNIDACVQMYPPVVAAPKPVPSSETLQQPLETLVAFARYWLDRIRPAGMYKAACIVWDCGVPYDHACLLVHEYAQHMGWDYDPHAVEDRVDHAYEYAAQPFGWRIEVERMRTLAT